MLTGIDALKVKQKFHDVDAILSDATAIKNQAKKAGEAAKDNADLHQAMQKQLPSSTTLTTPTPRNTRKSRKR